MTVDATISVSEQKVLVQPFGVSDLAPIVAAATAAAAAAAATAADLNLVQIADFKALATSSSPAPTVNLSWTIKGAIPAAQAVAWGGHSVPLAGSVRSFTPPAWDAIVLARIVGNSISDTRDDNGADVMHWPTLLAAALGITAINDAAYSSDWVQTLRYGVVPIMLTINGGILPAGGTSATVTAINGVTPSDSAIDGVSFLSVGDSTVLSGLTMGGMIGDRHVTVSVPNGGSASYSVVQDAGGAAVTLDGPVLFVPDHALSNGMGALFNATGQNYFYASIQQTYQGHTGYFNSGAFVNDALFRNSARGWPVLEFPVLPQADWATTGEGNPYDAMLAFNALRETFAPQCKMRDASGRTMLQRLQSAAISGDANDAADVAAGLIPRSLRTIKSDGSYDVLHPSVKVNAGQTVSGQQVIAAFAQEALAALTRPPSITQSTAFVLTAIGTDDAGNQTSSDQALARVSQGDLVALSDDLATLKLVAVAGGAPFKGTIAQGVAETAVGAYFTSKETGANHLYLRTADSPYYEDQGLYLTKDDVALGAVDNTPDASKPVSTPQAAALATKVAASDLSSTDDGKGASMVAMPDGGLVDSLEGPRRRIRALDLADDATDDAATDHTAALNDLFAVCNGQHRFPANVSQDLQTGGYKVGTSPILVPRSVGFAGEGRATRIFVKSDAASAGPVFAINTNGSGTWVKDYPGTLNVTYSNFYLDASAAAAASKYPLAFEVGASCEFDNILFAGFAQGIKQINSYIDQIKITRVVFTQIEDGSGRYFIDLQTAGDGCKVDQAHCSLNLTGYDYTTVARGRSTRCAYKVGSSITNSLNGDHEIYGCDGIETHGWHMEFGQARLIGSSATLRNHNFWTHRAAATNLHVSPILIDNVPGVSNAGAGVVAISDCGMMVQQNFHLGHNIGTLPDISVVSPWYGHLHIERVYRKHRLIGLTPVLGTKTGITTSDTKFNQYSHIASVKSDIIGNLLHITETLPSLPSSSGGLSVSSSAVNADYGLWQGTTGTYYYKAVFLYDTVRMVGLATGNEVSLSLTNGTGAARLVLEEFSRKMVRLYRGTTSGSYDSYVDVPLIAGVSLTDFGSDVMGFPWLSRTAGAIDAVNTGSVLQFAIAPAYTDYTNTAAYGNVVYHGYGTLVMPTTGAWRVGDLVLYKQPPGNSYIRLLGWRRMTNGSANVLGTDWEEIEEQKKPPAASSTELSSATNAWNTSPLKRTGRGVFNTTLGKMLWATGSSATSTWVDATGAVVITPS